MAAPKSRDVALLWQAWGVLEAKAGDAPAARALFKAAVRADPASEPSWLAWARLEESVGAYARADELRNFRMQERTELVLPATFGASLDPAAVVAAATGRDELGQSGAAGAAATVIAAVADWWKRLDAGRTPASRARRGSGGGGGGSTRRPSSSIFASSDDEEEGGEGGASALPSLEAMRAFDTPRLPALPDVADRRRSGSVSGCASGSSASSPANAANSSSSGSNSRRGGATPTTTSSMNSSSARTAGGGPRRPQQQRKAKPEGAVATPAAAEDEESK